MSEYTLGGVSLEVVGELTLPPMQPTNDFPAWSTDVLSINTPVIMLNGTLWRVLRTPQVQEDDRYLVVLRHPAKASQRVSFLVPASQESTPIWNTGQPLPTPPVPTGPEPIPVEPPPFEPPVNPSSPPQDAGQASMVVRGTPVSPEHPLGRVRGNAGGAVASPNGGV